MNPKPERIDSAYALVGGGIAVIEEKLVYFDGQKPPSESEIDTKLADLQAEYDAQEYARSRKVEYDALNQFELISDDTINGTTTHKDAIEAIKAKYPKP